MATGYERSVLLMIAALSLFCIFGVCAGQLDLVLGPRRNNNTITLTCYVNTADCCKVQDAVFYTRDLMTGMRMVVNETRSDLMNFERNGTEIKFTITPETEAKYFTCARNTTSENEASGLLVAGSYIRIRPQRDKSDRNPPRIVFPGQTFELECDVEPG